MQDCTVIVCSCDKYEDLWYPFFTLLKRNWINFDLPIILNTESKEFHMEGLDIKTFSFYANNDNVKWGERLLSHLNKVETDYVIILLEDFLLESTVRVEVIQKCVDYLNANSDISCFNFFPSRYRTIPSKYEGFNKRPRFSQYKLNAQACIWRKSDLIKYIRPFENPWVWEQIGTIRTFWTKKEFFCLSSENEKVFNYRLTTVIRGKYNYSFLNELFNKNDIEFNFSNKEFLTEEEIKKTTVIDYSLFAKFKRVKSYIINIVKNLKSLV